MASESVGLFRSRAEPSIGLALCAAVVVGWVTEQLIPTPEPTRALAPEWLPLVAAGTAAAGILPLVDADRWRRVQAALRWIGLLLLVWAANGLPFDLLTALGLMGRETASGAIVPATVYWPGLATRTLALTAAILLAGVVLALPRGAKASRPAAWYGYAAFLLALPYPLLRAHWALGGTLGLGWQGAAGEGWEPLLIAIPWVLAAALSLLLVSPRTRIPRRLVLAAGWSATGIVAMIGPAAVWALISGLASGDEIGSAGIAGWIFALFYISWFLWAIVAGLATRSYQVRSAGLPIGSVS